jgi:hypothetical protein
MALEVEHVRKAPARLVQVALVGHDTRQVVRDAERQHVARPADAALDGEDFLLRRLSLKPRSPVPMMEGFQVRSWSLMSVEEAISDQKDWRPLRCFPNSVQADVGTPNNFGAGARIIGSPTGPSVVRFVYFALE